MATYPGRTEITAVRIHLRSGEVVETVADEIFCDPPLGTRTPMPGPPGDDGKPSLTWLPVSPAVIFVHEGNGKWRRFYGASLEIRETATALVLPQRPGLLT